MSDFKMKTIKSSQFNNDQVDYQHESFGIINISRSYGSDRDFFGQVNTSDTTMGIKLSKCEVSQHLGRNWYHQISPITEVRISELQYAELITSKNSSVPCTISFDDNIGSIQYVKPSDKTWDIDTSLDSGQTFTSRISELQKEAKLILEKKGAFKKDDKLAVIAIAKEIKQLVDDNIDGYENSLQAGMSNVKENMRVEVQSHVDKVYTKVVNQINNQKLID